MVDQKQQVLNWLKAGAVWKDGVLLFRAIHGKNHPFLTVIKRSGSKLKYEILKQSLSLFVSACRSSNGHTENRPRKLREDFPFLNDPQCPNEFKILAADKITAYRNYTNGHLKFFDCITQNDYLAVATKVVENYILNRKILKEFDHFNEHGTVLGEHPIFRINRFIEQFKKMKIAQLVIKRKNLQHNIWRNRSEIIKGDRPDLYQSRIDAIQFKELLVIEIDRILEPYV